jgi:hypothetical protein
MIENPPNGAQIGGSGRIPAFLGNTIAHAPSGLRQHEQIGAGPQDERMGSIFLKSSAAYLAIPEQSLENEKDILRLTSYARFLILYVTVPIKAGGLGLPMKSVARVRSIIDLGQMRICLNLRSLCKSRIARRRTPLGHPDGSEVARHPVRPYWQPLPPSSEHTPSPPTPMCSRSPKCHSFPFFT